MNDHVTVQRGDNLSVIARRANLSLGDLLALNPGYAANPNHIQIGDVIRTRSPSANHGEPGGATTAAGFNVFEQMARAARQRTAAMGRVEAIAESTSRTDRRAPVAPRTTPGTAADGAFEAGLYERPYQITDEVVNVGGTSMRDRLREQGTELIERFENIVAAHNPAGQHDATQAALDAEFRLMDEARALSGLRAGRQGPTKSFQEVLDLRDVRMGAEPARASVSPVATIKDLLTNAFEAVTSRPEPEPGAAPSPPPPIAPRPTADTVADLQAGRVPDVRPESLGGAWENRNYRGTDDERRINAAVAHFFPGKLFRQALQTLKGENDGLNPFAYNVNKDQNASTDFGLFQINSNTFRLLQKAYPDQLDALGVRSYDDLADPYKNAGTARLLFDDAEGWHADGGWAMWYGAPDEIKTKQRVGRHSF